MKSVRGWTTAELIAREEVFDGLITKAARMTLRPITLNLNAIVVAAPELVAAGGPQLSDSDSSAAPIIVTTAGGQITALWDHYVDAELAPYLQQTFMDSAAQVLTGMESALDGSIPKITDSYAQAYLAAATNRLKGISDMVWEAVKAELQAGLDDGEGMHQLATRVRKVAGVMPGRATVIARTEVHAAAEQGSLAQVQLGGFTDAECSKRWLATDDVRTREEHWKANGQVVGITQPFDVWGEGLQFPGDPTGRAENVIQCRCTMEYLFADDALEDDDDLDDQLTTAASKHSLGDDWEEIEHPRGADGKFIKKGTHEYFEAVDAAKKAKLKSAATKAPKKSTGPVADAAAKNAHFDYLYVKNMTNPQFEGWFNSYFGPTADENNILEWQGLTLAEQDLVAVKAQQASQQDNIHGPYTVVSDWQEMEDANASFTPAATPGGGSLTGDPLMDALIDQEALKKASQPKKKTIVAKPLKINTNVIYKTEYGDGAVVAELPLKPPDLNYRLVWNAKEKKFLLQEQRPEGWKTVNKFGKGAAYQEFKDQTGWTTPAMALQEAADKIVAQHDASKIVVKELKSTDLFAGIAQAVANDPHLLNSDETSKQTISNFFDQLSAKSYAGYSKSQQSAIDEAAQTALDNGNPKPFQKVSDVKANQFLGAQHAADLAKVQVSQVVDPDDVFGIITGKMNIDVPALMAMPAPQYNMWFSDNFLDEDDQGLAKWHTLDVNQQAALTDKAELVQKLGYPNPLAVIKNAYKAPPPNLADDPKIPYPDFDDMDVVSVNNWFENLTLEQYGNFEEWEQEGIWDQAKEADEDFSNPKPLETLQALTGQFNMGGAKSTLPNFAAMDTFEKINWFDDFTQAKYDALTSDEVLKVVTESAKLNAAGILGPFKKISNLSNNAGSSGFVPPDFAVADSIDDMTKAAFQMHILDNAEVLQPPNQPSDEVWAVAAKYNLVSWLEKAANQKSPFNTTKSPDKMNAGEFMAYINGLGKIETPSDMYWNTAEKLGITPWAEQHTGQLSPHHDMSTLTPAAAPLVVKGMSVNTAPVPDKLDLTGLPSGPDAWQAVHTYAVAKVPAANTIGTPLAGESDFGELTKSSAKGLQEHMLKWGGKKWTPEQISAVQLYTTSPGYQSMNAVLRNDQKRMKLFSNSQLENAAQKAIDVQSAMTPLTSSVLLHRGTGAQAFGFNTKSVDTAKLKALEGKVIKERGFMSTSVVPPTGVGYDYATKPIKVIVRAPKGTPALYVTSATPAWDKENEMIIGAGSNFRIDSVADATEADKKLYGAGIQQIVVMTVVPDEGTPTDEIHAGAKVKTPSGTKVTPAPIVKPPTPPVATVVPNIDPIAPPLVPIKLNTKTIHSTAYAPNTVVAIRYAPLTPGGAPVTQRLVWSASAKKFALQISSPHGTGNWVNLQTLTKKDAFNTFKNDTNWFAPPAANAVAGQSTTIDVINGLLGVGPNSSVTPNPAPVVSVPVAKTKKTPPKTVDEIIGDYGTLPPNINQAAQLSIYTKFKTTSGFGTMMLGKPAETIFKALAAATAQWKNDNPNASLNHLQVLKLVDKIAAEKSATKINDSLYEKKILEWLQTSAGKKKAPDIIQLAEAAAKAPAPSVSSAPANVAQAMAQIPDVYSISTPEVLDEDFKKSPLNFPNMAPAQASAMNTAMRKKYPIKGDQVDAIKNYTGSASTAINNMLRYPNKGYHSVSTALQAKQIQEAMYPVPASITVHRGTDFMGNDIGGSLTIDQMNQLTGKTFSDGSFFSASVGNAAAFSGKKFNLEIEVPKGTPVLYAKPISSHKSENEIILGAGLHYKILSIAKVGHQYRVRVRVVNPT